MSPRRYARPVLFVAEIERVESNIGERPPGVVSGARHAFPGFPQPEDRTALMEAYAREGARPG